MSEPGPRLYVVGAEPPQTAPRRRRPGPAVLLVFLYAALFAAGLWWFRSRSPLFARSRVAPSPDRPVATREAIERAAAIARLDKDVADFPKGYDTMVGERGITLSGGQKQRTALARAIVTDPRILILDDALSAVDTYTEEEILSRLRGVMRERTSIIVSHRISTVRDADVIFVLDQGRIAERGTHDALIRQNGLYAELNKKQLLEEELAAS